MTANVAKVLFTPCFFEAISGAFDVMAAKVGDAIANGQKASNFQMKSISKLMKPGSL